MLAPLRLQAVVLEVTDLEAADRFYRWSFRLERLRDGDDLLLGWGKEDRLRLVQASRDGEAARTIGATLALRLPAATLETAVRWCAERGLEAITAQVPPAAAAAAAALLPGLPVSVAGDPRARNVSVITIAAWAGQRLDLAFPVPDPAPVSARQRQAFDLRSDDWSGLETPGLLGATWGGPDVAAGRALCERLGLAPLDPAEAASGPLRIGDQQLILEERERAGISGLALVVPAARVEEVGRTLTHLNAEHRLAGNRVLARDPEGRLVFVQGVHGR